MPTSPRSKNSRNTEKIQNIRNILQRADVGIGPTSTLFDSLKDPAIRLDLFYDYLLTNCTNTVILTVLVQFEFQEE